MADFYDRISGAASRIMARYNQGTVEHVRPGATTGPAWAPVVGAPVITRIDAVKMSGPRLQEYADQGLIRETDIMLACTGLQSEPVIGEQMRIDGLLHQIVMVDRATLPGAPGIVWMIGARR